MGYVSWLEASDIRREFIDGSWQVYLEGEMRVYTGKTLRSALRALYNQVAKRPNETEFKTMTKEQIERVKSLMKEQIKKSEEISSKFKRLSFPNFSNEFRQDAEAMEALIEYLNHEVTIPKEKIKEIIEFIDSRSTGFVGQSKLVLEIRHQLAELLEDEKQ